VPVVDRLDDLVLEPDTVLVLAVKSQDTRAALVAWADLPVRGGGVACQRLPVVCAQNGVANESMALRMFARVYAMCVWLPATYLEPGTVVAQGHPYSGVLHLGRYPHGTDQLTGAISADLDTSRFRAPVRAGTMRWKYGKLLGNLGNGLAALVASPAPDLYQRLRAEGRAVLDAAGIAYTSREEELAARGELVRIEPVAGRPR